MTVTADALLAVVPSIKVNGSGLTQNWYDALAEMRVERGLRVAGRAVLRFYDDDSVLVSKGTMTLGAPLEIAMRRPGASRDDPLLTGVVTGIASEMGFRKTGELVVVVHDRGHSLGRVSTPVAHMNKSAGDLVREIAQRHGLATSCDATQMQDYVLQQDTDHELLDRLADQLGCDWWVDGTTLHFEPVGTADLGTVAVELGTDLVDLTVRASGLHPDRVTVSGWDSATNQPVTASAQASDVSSKPNAPLFASYVSPGQGLKAQAELRTSFPPVRTQAEATALAKALRDDLVHAGLTASGTLLFGSRVGPGVSLTVEGPTHIKGTYAVTTVEHVFRDRFITRFTAGDRRPSSLVETLGRRPTSGQSASGLVVGVVTNIKDPDKKGKVRVKYVGRMGEHESHWARVLSAGAGAARGLVVQPEVNDEVLVGFEGGDLRQPVVLGGLFSGTATLPDVGIAEQVRARSLTSRLGHVVELSDGQSPGEQFALVQLQGKQHRLKIAKDAVELVMPAGVPFSLRVGSTGLLEFDKAGALTIKATSVKIEATGAFNVEANGVAEIKAKGSATVEATGAAILKSAGVVQVDGGMTMIKGTPVAIN